MKAILDWIIVLIAAVAAPWAYANVGGAYMGVADVALPGPLSGPLSQYTAYHWLWLLGTPLLALGHLVLLVLLNEIPRRSGYVILAGAIVQGAAWALLAATIIAVVMNYGANVGGEPASVGSQLAALFGVALPTIAAVVFGVLGAISGALAGFARFSGN